MIYRRENGLEILDYWAEDAAFEADDTIPLTFVLIGARYAGHWLLIYNQERLQWEIPGGGILPNETPLQCARRELCEESCQVADELLYRGRFLIRLPEGHCEYGMLYQTELADLYPFTPNEEATQLRLLPCDDLHAPDVDGFQRFMFAQCHT